MSDTAPYPSDRHLRHLRHGSISQAEREHFGVQGEESRPLRTPMPGFDPDADWGTETWSRERDEWWEERKRQVQEAHDE